MLTITLDLSDLNPEEIIALWTAIHRHTDVKTLVALEYQLTALVGADEAERMIGEIDSEA